MAACKLDAGPCSPPADASSNREQISTLQALGMAHKQDAKSKQALQPHSYHAGAVSAQQLHRREVAAGRIVTFCKELDAILGGGIALSQITEFCEQAEACADLDCAFDN